MTTETKSRKPVKRCPNCYSKITQSNPEQTAPIYGCAWCNGHGDYED